MDEREDKERSLTPVVEFENGIVVLASKANSNNALAGYTVDSETRVYLSSWTQWENLVPVGVAIVGAIVFVIGFFIMLVAYANGMRGF